MTLFLLLSLATANDLAQDPPAPPAAQELTVDEPEPVPTNQLMDDAVRRIRLADYEGARLLLDDAAGREDADIEEILYLRGVSWELDRDYTSALGHYNDGLQRYPTGARAEDFAFRRAEVIGGLGRPDDALGLLEPFTSSLAQRGHADQVKIRLVEAIWLAESGKQKIGLKRIAETLEEAGADEVTFYQAKARATVVSIWAAQASALSLDVRERKQVKRLTKRGETLIAIEKQVTTIALLKEPEWVLAGLLTLGQSYEAVGTDLISVSPPRKLDPEVHALYRQAVAERGEVILVKALNHYQKGIDLALRLGWKSRRIGELEQARDSVADQIERLPTAS